MAGHGAVRDAVHGRALHLQRQPLWHLISSDLLSKGLDTLQGYLAHTKSPPFPRPPYGPRFMLLQVPRGRLFLRSEVPLRCQRENEPLLGPFCRDYT